MSDEKPNKVIELSPIEKWWAEVQEWHSKRRSRDRTIRGPGITVKVRGRRKLPSEEGRSKSFVIGVLGFIGTLLIGFVELFFGLFRFAIWIVMIGGFIWLLTMIAVKDATVDEAKEQAVETEGKTRGEVGDVIQSIQDSIGRSKRTGTLRYALNRKTARM